VTCILTGGRVTSDASTVKSSGSTAAVESLRRVEGESATRLAPRGPTAV
jgi:hypothetical protein